jgi:MFS family permease
LELTASRILAQSLGVSLFTWTGIIGVMLAGTALGNFTGGWIADRVNRPGSAINPRYFLGGTLLAAGGGTIFLFVAMALINQYKPFDEFDPIAQVMCWTFCLFFFPMYVLGMVSPQVIKMAVPDIAHVGQVAGRVYAWSTTGAILGTFVAGYLLLSAIGMHKTILCVALLLTLTSLLIADVWNYNPLLYLFSIVLGGITGGLILTSRSPTSLYEELITQEETNYYTINVSKEKKYYGRGDRDFVYTGIAILKLDALIHSSVDPDNPFYIHYRHEYVQMEFLQGSRKENPNPRVLVVGGGGYTFPRYAMEVMPEARMDVVEIDPGVTKVAHEHLGLKDYPGLTVHHMDGRQYVAERVPPGTYDLVVQDAVNDLSVPSHLLTKEYNDAVKATLKPNGVYLLTVIDSIGYGKLWKAAIHTLQQSYPPENIALLFPDALDQTRFLLSDEAVATLQSLKIPESVLTKLSPLKNKLLNREKFEGELTAALDPSETKEFLSLILDHATDLSERQVYVIYASDHPLDLNTLRAAVSEQVLPGFTAANRVGSMAGTMQNLGGIPHALAIATAEPKISEEELEVLFRTHRMPQVDLQPYLDTPPRIILTDQYAPVDNLMADVFRYRNRKRPKE